MVIKITDEENIYCKLVADMTSTEFEIYCMNILKTCAEKEGLHNFSIKHNDHFVAHDGTYQIDISAEYTALGVKNTVLIECKKYTRSVERKVVTDLCKKIETLGANKGIIISTAGFQSGAVQFAKQHGIALLQMIDRKLKHIVNSVVPDKIYMLLMCQMDLYLPSYFVMKWDCEACYPYNEIYPTSEMYKIAEEKAKKYLIETYGELE